MEALRVDSDQSNEARMSGRRDGGAVVRARGGLVCEPDPSAIGEILSFAGAVRHAQGL